VRAAGKGKGKGPIDGCLICGGAHYQSVCPNGAQSSLRTLCYLKEVKEKVEEEVEEAARGKLKPTRARNFELYIYMYKCIEKENEVWIDPYLQHSGSA
jgi:hypothetical protein